MAQLHVLLVFIILPTISHGQTLTLSGVSVLTLTDGTVYPVKYYSGYQLIPNLGTRPYQVFTMDQCLRECVNLGTAACNAVDFLASQPVGIFNCFTHWDPDCSLLPALYLSKAASTHYKLSHLCDPVRVIVHDDQVIDTAALPIGIIMVAKSQATAADCGLFCNVRSNCVAADYGTQTGCRHFDGSSTLRSCLLTTTDTSYTTYMNPCYTAPFVGIHYGTVAGSTFVSTTTHDTFSGCRAHCMNDPQCIAYRYTTYWEFLKSLTFSSRCELNKENSLGVNVACRRPEPDRNRFTVYKKPCLNVDVIDIHPLLGPKSGGTSVTIRGFTFENVQFVSINNIPCNIQTITLQNLTCLTGPLGDGMTLNTLLEVRLHSNNTDISSKTGFQYQYRPDPTITHIQPLKSILSGGVLLTVNGTGFDSVNLRIMVTKVTSLGSGNTYSTQTECSLVSPTVMTCPTPPIDLSRLYRRRRRRQTANTVNTEENIDVEIYFLLDGVQQYRDLSGTNLARFSRITIYADPVIERFEQTVQTFTTTWPVGDTQIEIKGSMLLGGLEQKDYTVKIGEAKCGKINVQDNLITCEPPTMRPEVTPTEYVGDNRIPLNVLYAGKVNSLGQLRYYQTLWEYPPGMYTIIGGSCGIVFIIVVIITVACMCRRRPPTRRDAGHHTYQRRIYNDQPHGDSGRDRDHYRSGDRDHYRSGERDHYTSGDRDPNRSRDRDQNRSRDRDRDRRRY